MFESCGKCDIHISFSQIHNLSRMLIAHVKFVHPDLHPNKSLQDSHPNGSLQESSLQDSHPNASLRCSIQDINNIIDQLRAWIWFFELVVVEVAHPRRQCSSHNACGWFPCSCFGPQEATEPSCAILGITTTSYWPLSWTRCGFEAFGKDVGDAGTCTW